MSLLVAIGFIVRGVLLLYFLWCDLNPPPTKVLSFIQSATGVQFPPSITQYAQFNDGMGSMTVHLTLPPTKIKSFIQQQHFTISPSGSQDISDVSLLPVPFNKVPTSADYALRGSSEKYRWNFVLDARSGNLWVHLYYPDDI